MSISDKLGAGYTASREQSKTKTVEVKINDALIKLKIRVPTKTETEDELTVKAEDISEDLVDARYKELAGSLEEALKALPEDKASILKEERELEIIDGVVFSKGNSVRDIARNLVVMDEITSRLLTFIKTETGEPITLKEFQEEFDELSQKNILGIISDTVKPDYSASRKN